MADRKQTEADNAAAMKRMEQTQPTPTQAEIDQAKRGVESLKQLDDKEPDGSPEEGEDDGVKRSMTSEASGAYKTRASKGDKA